MEHQRSTGADKPSTTHSAQQPQDRQEQPLLETLGREKRPLSSPAPKNTKDNFPLSKRRPRRSEPWLLLTWGRASSPGLFLITGRAPHQDLEGEQQDTVEAVKDLMSRGGFLALGLQHAPHEAAQASRQLIRHLYWPPKDKPCKPWQKELVLSNAQTSTPLPFQKNTPSSQACSAPGLASAEMLTAVRAGTQAET